MDAAAVGAFLSGAGAVLSSVTALHFMRKRMEKDCQRRIDEVRKSIHEGYEMREEKT